ncbi:MAG: ABC transporter permease [Planctomycetota bacterium]
MWAYIVRRLLYYIPLYLCILAVVLLLLRINQNEAVAMQLGKQPSQEQIDLVTESLGLNKSKVEQYWDYITDVLTLEFSARSWDQQRPVGEMLRAAIVPTLMITVPSLLTTAVISIGIGLVCAFNRGRWLDRGLMFGAVLGMSVSYLVYIILGQYFGAYVLGDRMHITPFAIEGYESIFPRLEGGDGLFYPMNWVRFAMLPVIIGVIVAMGYDTRFYRAVMVEESGRDHITTARAKGAGDARIMSVHMLKNAMIPIISRITITLPFLITGSILVEQYFNIPGMGRMLINGIVARDFPVVQATVAVLAAAVILTVILTDVAYALVDPRVRLK